MVTKTHSEFRRGLGHRIPMNEEAIILKRDAAGRVVVTEQQRVDLVRAYERSRLSGSKFAELADVSYRR
jgi:hypothetical protein